MDTHAYITRERIAPEQLQRLRLTEARELLYSARSDELVELPVAPR